jgi:hypothetical protein
MDGSLHCTDVAVMTVPLKYDQIESTKDGATQQNIGEPEEKPTPVMMI